MFSCNKMKSVIESILKARNLVTQFDSGEFQLKIDNAPYIPLTIERHGKIVSVTHYYEHNGDLVPDPDMEFIIGTDENLYPVGIQYSIGIYRRARWTEGDKELIDPREARDQTRFANVWAKNIKDQGFINAGI